ncbi:MAG TPA: DUF624 domain-containing protein [Limnochordia bacterium]|nr:DUF624 domain-containing protein [Limnochordia bacterium]
MAGESVRKGWRIVVDGFHLGNDSIPAVMWASVLWFIVGAAPTLFWGLTWAGTVQSPSRLLAAFLLMLTAALLLSPATVAAHALMLMVRRREPTGFRAFFTAFAHHYRRAAGVGLAMSVIGVVVLSDITFFYQSSHVVLRLLSIVWLYFVLFWLLMMNYAPAMVVWQPQTDVLTLLKRSALLVLDNLVVTLVISAAALTYLAGSVLLRVPFFLIFMGAVAALETAAVERLLSRYLEEEPEQEPSGEQDDEDEAAGSGADEPS